MLSLLLSAAAGAASACAVSEPVNGDGLVLAENRWVAALEARDVQALECRLARGFTDSNWRGDLVRRAAVLAGLPSRPPSQLTLSELTVEVRGKVGIVRGVNTQTSAGGTIIGRVRFTDVFVRGGGRWQALSAQETLIPSVNQGASD